MVKKVTNRLGFLMGTSLILLLCVTVLFPIKAKALETDSKTVEWLPIPSSGEDYYDYITSEEEDENFHHFELNKEYELNMKSDYGFDFVWCNTDRKKNFYKITVQSYNRQIDEFELYNCSNLDNYKVSQYYRKDSFKSSYDKKNKIYTYCFGLTSDAVYNLLYINNYSDSAYKIKVKITEEPAIVLSQTSISEITNTKSHTMTVKYAPVKKRLGYQIEYADNSKFNNKTRVNTGATTKDIGKLTIGKTYYVRVRSYARYSDGTLVYSKWSGTRKIKIKK